MKLMLQQKVEVAEKEESILKLSFEGSEIFQKNLLRKITLVFEAAVHEAASAKADVIIAEKMPETGLGNSMNDRLQRAAFRS